jgi:hypothetical protein
MTEKHTVEDIKNKAHSLNCQLYEDGYSPRDIEIIGYYLNRIAASYLSYFTHKEYEETFQKEVDLDKEAKETYKHL